MGINMQEIILKNNMSDHFTLISYPDGQNSIKLNLNKLDKKITVSIKCRIRNFSELEVLFCLVKALEKNDFYINKIYFVYLFGMRSDRAFEVGEPNYLKDVIFPILELFPYKILILRPHSTNILLNKNNIEMIDIPHSTYIFDNIIGGDESVNKWFSCNSYFKKTRLNGINVDFITNIEFNEKPLTIVDDLCDGGATFIEEGKYLKKHFPNKKLKLFVYHGLFTQGIHPLLTYFDEIICTNSYQDIDHPNVTQIKVI